MGLGYGNENICFHRWGSSSDWIFDKSHTLYTVVTIFFNGGWLPIENFSSPVQLYRTLAWDSMLLRAYTTQMGKSVRAKNYEINIRYVKKVKFLNKAE